MSNENITNMPYVENNAPIIPKGYTEIVEEDGVMQLSSDSENAIFTSLKNDGTRASQIKIYNAINNADESLSDHLNEKIKITDLVAHNVIMPDEKTGLPTKQTRIVLITEDGNYFQAVSKGLLGSLMKINALISPAPWTPALTIIPREKKTRKGYKVMTLELA